MKNIKIHAIYLSVIFILSLFIAFNFNKSNKQVEIKQELQIIKTIKVNDFFNEGTYGNVRIYNKNDPIDGKCLTAAIDLIPTGEDKITTFCFIVSNRGNEKAIFINPKHKYETDYFKINSNYPCKIKFDQNEAIMFLLEKGTNNSMVISNYDEVLEKIIKTKKAILRFTNIQDREIDNELNCEELSKYLILK